MAGNRRNKFKPPSLLDLQDRFSSEKDCAEFLFNRRWPDGFKCPRCGTEKCYPIKRRGLYECAACRYQVSVTAGTVLHGTRTPLRLWFTAIFLMTTDKRGISSVWLGKQLGVSQKRAWVMLHKLRKAMAVRNGRYKLDGVVELDESFFGAPKEGGCRGRGMAKQKVLVGLSLTKDGKPLHLRLQVLPSLDRAHLEPAIEDMVVPGATVKTNGLRSYLTLGDKGYRHERIIATRPNPSEESRWLQVIVSNVKALLGGTHHGLGRADGKHLQAYLHECSYRFDRRHRPDTIFDRCVSAAAACPIWTYRDITGATGVGTKGKLQVA